MVVLARGFGRGRTLGHAALAFTLALAFDAHRRFAVYHRRRCDVAVGVDVVGVTVGRVFFLPVFFNLVFGLGLFFLPPALSNVFYSTPRLHQNKLECFVPGK